MDTVKTIESYPAAFAHQRRKSITIFSVLVALVAYMIYLYVAFDISGLAQKASLDKAKLLVKDSYSYKVHVTRDNRNGSVEVKVEGESKGAYPENTAPNWIELGETTTIDLGNGHSVEYRPKEIVYSVPDFGVITATASRKGVEAVIPEKEFPGNINQSKNRLAITTESGRLTITRNKTEVFRYFNGWELFFFSLESEYFDEKFTTLLNKSYNGELGNILSDFWNNKMWRHKDVAWAIGETILMAFLGTFGGALVALPLSILAARNFTPLNIIRGIVRRFFDFIRGVDALIFTIMLSRAFGPGPMTGALAMLITDTGSFGKVFSEALENVDDKQIEGVASTGATPIQRIRFGVLPQVAPVFLALILYFFESNTRSATIIGAITGGGIGLLLTQAMITQKDWEEVTYYVVLIILMVTLMDWLSGQLRARLIKGGESHEL